MTREMSTYKFEHNQVVIFKQREARHLAFSPELPWEYQDGNVIGTDEDRKTVAVCWLQGHSSRTDQVPIEDIVIAHIEGAEDRFSIGSYRNVQGIALQDVVKEGVQ